MRISDWSSDVCSSDLVRILILEKLLPRQVLQPAHESRKAAVADRHIAFCAALGDILQAQRLARRLRMALAQRRRAKALVRGDILLVADAQRGEIEQAHDRGDDAFRA